MGHDVNAFSTATVMLEALRRRDISSVELLDLHQRRIAQYNPALNAIIAQDGGACPVAAEVDAARARGEDRPLLGLPMTIKDPIYVKGLPLTAGAPEHAHNIADSDALVVTRLRTAGAVIMGKTNVPPYSMDWQTDNPVFGRTNNPWDLTCTPGGSTGGGAAALAAGLTPLEFGGDMGGSIRIPAAFCGVYGHRPSETALPRSGYFPGPTLPNPVVGISVVGPLARSAEDLELAFDATAGPDVGEDVAWRLEIPPARHATLPEFRVAVFPPIDWQPVDGEIVTALDALAARLGQLCAKVAVAKPEALGDVREFYATYKTILAAMQTVGRSAEECRKEAAAIRQRTQDPDDLAWAVGREGTPGNYLEWYGRREWYRAAFREFFRNWDVLLTPANVVNALPHGTYDPQVNGMHIKYDAQFLYPSLATLVGHPATAFPAGHTVAGLPIGLQAIGPYLEDRTPMRFCALLAREFGGFSPPPGFSEN